MLRKSLLSVNFFPTTFIRNLTSTEVSSALRPFYFSVHPDLFGQHPKERAINETSLQQLSSVLEALQSSKYSRPITLPFYVKNRSDPNEAVRLIKIYLKEPDIETTIVNILKACNLPTEHLEHLVESNGKEKSQNIYNEKEWVSVRYKNEYDFTKMNKNHPLFATYIMQQKIKKARESLRLRNWLQQNCSEALEKCKSGQASRIEIKRLKEEVVNNFKLKEIIWDCGWNGTHFRGCLLAFKSLMEQHPEQKKVLVGQVLVFSYFTGISLDGHIMLFSGEVRHNWLDFIKKIRLHRKALERVPFYERSLSHVLRNMKVGRRKFMPKVMVGEYERNLKQLTTSISDYVGHRAYPENWPKTMEKYEIVVESEAGPMMVSPTGQFIVPASIPGPLLVNFITSSFQEADDKIKNYKKDKIMEKQLHTKCVYELNLSALHKDDNITPELMIKFCIKLLESKEQVRDFTKNLHVNVATYYSVLSDGIVCIPWNFNL
ncbi:T-cell activation inhibitor, mitochondrial [Sitophilus oryzae]|uniref:T-cell activation inhibitor, mitochondrial n=1 Tax=Sitophilus oryzae TaxID=7048 RepID=A0A6J2Y0C4_SITOR|nr:T-cell activation inhibitor, mitochondrial [Sitophilus oryzae]